ncbi:nucleotidyltransferase family protein [Gallibacterium trehalosifermentans]|uniref:Nucleotidyltransferase family protein n=1 Tax=Gallibacterium trehalosifermentans TaxID=516935 RepID=A0ABV6GZI1_9PAST
MLDIQPQHLAIVKQILQDFLPEYEVRAFGSRVKGTASQFSDLDLVIMSDTPLSLRRLCDVENAFSDSDLPYTVDVVDWAATSAEFQKIIAQKYVVIQAKA